MTTEPWVSVEGVARHLGAAKDSVYRWIEVRADAAVTLLALGFVRGEVGAVVVPYARRGDA
jgi:hypothetical protein